MQIIIEMKVEFADQSAQHTLTFDDGISDSMLVSSILNHQQEMVEQYVSFTTIRDPVCLEESA